VIARQSMCSERGDQPRAGIAIALPKGTKEPKQ